MHNLIAHPDYQLYERKGEPLCSSLQVAETFGKRHDDVLKKIRLTREDCSAEFGLRNFAEMFYNDGYQRKQPLFLMTKDGFAILAMSFTGKKAMAFKEGYIRRFNEMEAYIKSLAAVRDEHPAFTDAVLLAHEEPKFYHFANETDMINRIVLGRPAKAVREEYGLPKGQSIRPYLNDKQLADIKALQMADVGLLATIPDFSARKSALEALHCKRAARLLAA
ncbi:MAG: Rha family transcriptional regulator [Deltaproteobacteria bacterium]|nr:Rha family transcriptional regulator [Deltaproteobacteria bacterium]